MIKLHRVSKIYPGGFTALKEISLSIDKGEFVFLTGESGAGKTTLLKHLFCEEFPTSGEVTIGDFTLRGRANIKPKRGEIELLRRKTGIVFQDIRLLSDRNIYDNISYVARITRSKESEVRKATYNALTAVGLSHKTCHLPKQLSGGEQQRIAIARAIVNEPQILIADEPTGNLDTRISYEIFHLLENINSWGTTVIMATHEERLVHSRHYREIKLHRGELIQGGGSTSYRRVPKSSVQMEG